MTGWDITGHHGSGCNNSMFPDPDSRQNDRACADIASRFQNYGTKFYRRKQYRDIGICHPMLRCQDRYIRPYSDIGFYRQACCTVKKTILPDPAIVSDDHFVQMIPFEYCTMSDVHIAANLDIFGMKDQYLRFKDHMIAYL